MLCKFSSSTASLIRLIRFDSPSFFTRLAGALSNVVVGEMEGLKGQVDQGNGVGGAIAVLIKVVI